MDDLKQPMPGEYAEMRSSSGTVELTWDVHAQMVQEIADLRRNLEEAEQERIAVLKLFDEDEESVLIDAARDVMTENTNMRAQVEADKKRNAALEAEITALNSVHDDAITELDMKRVAEIERLEAENARLTKIASTSKMSLYATIESFETQLAAVKDEVETTHAYLARLLRYNWPDLNILPLPLDGVCSQIDNAYAVGYRDLLTRNAALVEAAEAARDLIGNLGLDFPERIERAYGILRTALSPEGAS